MKTTEIQLERTQIEDGSQTSKIRRKFKKSSAIFTDVASSGNIRDEKMSGELFGRGVECDFR